VVVGLAAEVGQEVGAVAHCLNVEEDAVQDDRRQADEGEL